MAKMFYTTEEAAAKLGISADQLKQFVAENKLREFRDGIRVMFKVDQVDRLSGDAKKGGSAGGIGLSDSGIQLAAPDSTGTHDALSLSDTDSARAHAKEDTVLSTPPGAASGTGIPLTGSATNMPATGGPALFDTGELKPADAAAQTQIQPAVDDQLSLEGVGSGSGLLDLTRESDDTSLGAELLDEIYPGDSKAGGAVPSASGIFAETPSAAEPTSGPSGLENMAAVTPAAPTILAEAVEAPDAGTSAIGGLSMVAILAMLATLLALGTAQIPSWISTVANSTAYLAIFGGVLVVLAILFAGVGFFVGKATSR